MTELNVLGLLPARGGSKGIPRKNIMPLCGRPLLAWAAAAIIEAPSVGRAVCSTDDELIAKAAKCAGLDVPFCRPDELATDKASVVDVICHAVDTLDDPNHPYTHIALVQATTPTVTVDDVEKAINMVRSGGADTVISGFHAGMHHPAIMYTLDESGGVKWLLSGGEHCLRRQDIPPVFIRTGLIYILSVNVLRKRKSLYGDRIHALVVDEDRAVTIDEERDFYLAQRQMEKVHHG